MARSSRTKSRLTVPATDHLLFRPARRKLSRRWQQAVRRVRSLATDHQPLVTAFKRLVTQAKRRPQSNALWGHRLAAVEALEPRHLLATIMVTNTNDAGAGSFRAALTAAEAAGNDDIVFDSGLAGGTITLASPLGSFGSTAGDGALSITGLTDAGGSPNITLNGNSMDGFVWDNDAMFTLRDMTITNFGGLFASTLQVRADNTLFDNLRFTNNTPDSAFGAALNIGNKSNGTFSTVISNSIFAGNQAKDVFQAGATGGALYVVENNTATHNVTISNSLFYENVAEDQGGGLGNGGALQVQGAAATIVNSTFVDNSADGNGGGIDILLGGTVALQNTIVTGNTAGGSGNDVNGSPTQTTSLVGAAVNFANAAADDYRLAATATNAIDQGTDALAIAAGLTLDLDGNLRIFDEPSVANGGGGAVDIGAYEFNSPAPAAMADLSIAKTDSTDPVNAASGFSYSLAVSNAGPGTATSVSVSDTLPAGVGFVSASGTGWSCGEAAGVVTCTRASLNVGAAPAITINVTAPAEGGNITNTASVTATTTDNNAANDSDMESTSITAVADLSIAKTDSADPVNVAAGYSYSLAVSNAGPSTATSLSVSDTLPAGVGFVSASGTGWSCGEAAGVVTCTRPSLSVGAAPAITINVTAPVSPGNITNSATVSAATTDNASGNDSDMETTTITQPPAFDKAFAPDTIAGGGVSTLTFTIDNTANVIAAGSLDFTDNLPGAVTVAAPANASTTCTGGTLTATSGTSVISYSGGSVGMGASCTVQVDVTSSTIGTHPNTTGNLTSSLGNSGTANDSLVVEPPPTFAKLFSPDTIIVGGSTLTFTIDNSASSLAASGLDFTDNLPAGVVVATPPAASTTCTGGTLTAAAGSSVISYTGGTVAAGATCTVQVDVTSSTAGSHVNTTGDLTSSSGNSGTAADTLNVTGLDFGDAPDAPGGLATGNPYPTLLEHDGARHALAGAFLGASIDDESDGQPDVTATGDDVDGNDDEDGVLFTSPLIPGLTATVDVTTTGTGLLNAWIDFNDNGSWADPGEQIFTDMSLGAGANNGLTFPVPFVAPTAQTLARFRFDQGGGLSYDGQAPDGEVEDYEVAISGCSTTVTNASDMGAGSLRYAIQCANATPGVDTIDFNILGPPGTVHTIAPMTNLPPIIEQATVDATTQMGYSGTPLIQLDGSPFLGLGGVGLRVNSNADGSIIRGFNLVGFSDKAVFISRADNVQVEANFIGTNPAGTAADPNGNNIGVLIINGAGNTIGGTTAAQRNLIGGNSIGISIIGPNATNNTVSGNFIGTDVTGSSGIFNTTTGVEIAAAPGNTVGGSTSGSTNVISSNENGIDIRGSNSTGNMVFGNIIGTDITTIATMLGNLENGVLIRNGADGNLVTSNVISANLRDGVHISNANMNTIQANIIGELGSEPSTALGNRRDGIEIRGDSQNNLVGGSGTVGAFPLEANVLAGNNHYGVKLLADNNQVQGNRIGTNSSGLGMVGNGRGGVLINNASGNTIGGANTALAEPGNQISSHQSAAGAGVLIIGNAANNTVAGNWIGTRSPGTIARPNLVGVRITSSGSGNLVGGDSTSGEGNVISGNTASGVDIRNADGVNVFGNLIGTNAAGDTALANGEDGVEIVNSTNVNVGGAGTGQGNIISGNTAAGVEILSGAATLQANRIGTDLAGNAAIPNDTGVVITGTGATIGGDSTAGEGNQISGNTEAGVHILGGVDVTSNTVRGNLIGTDSTGASDVANKFGVRITDAPENTIGGTSAGDGNTISGNLLHGVFIQNFNAFGNLVQGNQIGTNLTGTAAVPNLASGVLVDDALTNFIGGAAPGAGNVISGNSLDGIKITGTSGSNNQVSGNAIGVDADGTTALPNRNGILIADGAAVNHIGINSAGSPSSPNTIANNNLSGVWINPKAGIGNTVRQNSIHDNGGLGIALSNTGVLINDAGDPDVVQNNLQNSPVIESVTENGPTMLDVTVVVESAVGNSTYDLLVEFYIADAASQEGETFLDQVTYPAAVAGGSASFTIQKGTATVGTNIVATATDFDGGSLGSTSEFSAPVTVTAMLQAAAGPAAGASAPSLTHPTLAPIVDAAVVRLAALGLDASLLASIDVSIADLPGAALGLATADSITIDVNAAGHGWFIDATPLDDSEFLNPQSAIGKPQSIDLLTAVMHELGHVAGLDDLHDADAKDDVMYGWLEAGQRRTSLAASLADAVFGDL